MSIIRKDFPADAPANDNPIGSQAWADWIVKSRSSTDYVVILFTDPAAWPVVKPYPFLHEHRRQIERGEAHWLSLADATSLTKQEPQPYSSRLPEGAAQRIRAGIQGLQDVLDGRLP